MPGTMPYVNFNALSRIETPKDDELKMVNTIKKGEEVTIKMKNGNVLTGTFEGFWDDDNDDGVFIKLNGSIKTINSKDYVEIIGDLQPQINEVLKRAGVQIDESIILDPEENEKWRSSPKGQLVQQQPIQNVGQLMELLKKLPADTPLAGGDKYKEFEYPCEVYIVREYYKYYLGFISKTW